MDRIIFSVYSKHVRVKHVLIIAVCILLLFLLTFCRDTQDQKKKTPIGTTLSTCEKSSRELIQLELLITRGDLCSDAWFKEIHAYQEELQLAIKQEKNKTFKKEKQKLHDAIEVLLKDTNEETITQLEDKVLSYRSVYQSACK